MAKLLFCIFCDSLDVSESIDPYTGNFEYSCKECYENWADDESEFEDISMQRL